MTEADLEQLQTWVRQARDADGRVLLAAEGVPRQVAALLSDVMATWVQTRSAVEERRLLLSLRVLRNLCVGLPEAQDQVDQAGLVATLALVCDSFLNCHDSDQRGLMLEAALQALGNACVQHVHNQEATWCEGSSPGVAFLVLTRQSATRSKFYPAVFKRVAALRGLVSTLYPAC